MKLQCVMKDSWKISNFPFDRQTLRLSIENSQFDKKDNQAKAQRFDMIIAQVLLLI